MKNSIQLAAMMMIFFMTLPKAYADCPQGTAGIAPAVGVKNFDGSITYNNPTVCINGSFQPLASPTNTNSPAFGFCALKEQEYVSEYSHCQEGVDADGDECLGTNKTSVDLNDDGSFSNVSNYAAVYSFVICK